MKLNNYVVMVLSSTVIEAIRGQGPSLGFCLTSSAVPDTVGHDGQHV